MPERMLTYNIDKIFWGILSVLLVSPMLYWYDSFGVMNTNSTVVYPITTILVRSFPFSLVYSALGSVAVVAIAWERIANARNTRMDALIKRAWDKRTREPVDRVGDAISNHRSVDSAIIAEFLSVWKKSGKIFHIDQLCPKAALNDLEQLVPIALKYDKAWSDFEERIRRSGVPGTKEYVLGLKDLLDRGDGVYYAWVEPGHSGDLPSSFTSIGRRDRDRLVALKSDLEKSDYLIKDREGFWKKELSERASRIRDAFRDLVAERGLAD